MTHLKLSKLVVFCCLFFSFDSLAVRQDAAAARGGPIVADPPSAQQRSKWSAPPELLEEGRMGGDDYVDYVDPDSTTCCKDHRCFSCFGCTGKEVTSCCQMAFNWRWCKPTVKRALGTTAFAAIGAGAGVIFWKFGLDILGHLIDSLALFVLLNATESATSVAALFLHEPTASPKTLPEDFRKLAVIIPVHGAGKDVGPTLDSALAAGFQPEQIFVIENTGGKYAGESGKVYKTLRAPDSRFNRVNYRINYRIINEWASKVTAEYLGHHIAQQQGFEYALAIDDDVMLPPDFDPHIPLIKDNPTVKLIAFPITVANNSNWLTQRQKNEYERAGRHNLFKSKLGNVHAVHGAISLAHIPTYLDVMRERPVDGAFYAEDQKKGAAFRWKGHQVVMASGTSVPTEVPDNCCSFCNQRTKWEIGAQKSCCMYTEDCLTDCPRVFSQDECIKWGVRKIYQTQTVLTNFNNIVKPLLLISLSPDRYYWAVTAIIWQTNVVVDVANDIWLKPHRTGRSVCNPKQILWSCADHQCSFWYTALQAVQGVFGACCAWMGAGAASPQDFPYMQEYPPEFKDVLRIRNPRKRAEALDKIAAGFTVVDATRELVTVPPASANGMGTSQLPPAGTVGFPPPSAGARGFVAPATTGGTEDRLIQPQFQGFVRPETQQPIQMHDLEGGGGVVEGELYYHQQRQQRQQEYPAVIRPPEPPYAQPGFRPHHQGLTVL